MASDETISVYSQLMTDYVGFLTNYFVLDEDSDIDMFSKNPYEVFFSQNSNLLIVNSPAKCYSETDQCEFGCWRIIGCERLIKCKYTGTVLGFKKILKFCENNKPIENERSWVMEEYRFKSKQDISMCKIQLMYEAELSMLIYKHFSSNYHKSSDQQEKAESYLKMIIDFDDNYWRGYCHINSEVYQVDPQTLVPDLQDLKLLQNGTCIFTYAGEIYGRSYECDVGYWKILDRDGTIMSKTGEIMGLRRVLQFYEIEKRRVVFDGKEIEGNWIIEEYRLAEEEKGDIVLCVIKFMSSDKLNRLLKRSLGT